MAFEDANEKAFEGGDTEPETAKIIHDRNQALQTLNDKQREAMQKRQEAEQEALDAALEAEQATADDNFDLITGAPVVTPPENIGAGSEKGASSPAQSQTRKQQAQSQPPKQGESGG